jgi:isopentenyl-diphosphate delta-isomerase
MEQVILVDEQNNEIGVAPKDTVHTDKTPLHRAFSLFLFNNKNQLLVTQRALNKKTFPGVWTNSVCGHVSPGEETVTAVKRRVQEELHIQLTKMVLSKMKSVQFL